MCTVPIPIRKWIKRFGKSAGIPDLVLLYRLSKLRVSGIHAGIENRNTHSLVTIFAVLVDYGVDDSLQIVEPLISPFGSITRFS